MSLLKPMISIKYSMSIAVCQQLSESKIDLYDYNISWYIFLTSLVASSVVTTRLLCKGKSNKIKKQVNVNNEVLL